MGSANQKHGSLASLDPDSYLLKRNLTIEGEHEPFSGEDIPRSAAGLHNWFYSAGLRWLFARFLAQAVAAPQQAMMEHGQNEDVRRRKSIGGVCRTDRVFLFLVRG